MTTSIGKASRGAATAVAAAVLLATSLSACDASPYAANVNGHVVKQTALEVELKAWASAPDYVNLFDEANSTQNGGQGLTVAGVRPGATYDMYWVDTQLYAMVIASIVHQSLGAEGAAPDSGMIEASRSVNEIARSSYWFQLSATFRQTLVDRLAERGALSSAAVPASTLQQVYQQYKSQFFSQICVQQATVFTSAEALAIAASGDITSAPVCYDQVALEGQPQAFRSALIALGTGQVSQPIQTSFGYTVVKFVSRVDQSYGPDLERVISAAIVDNSSTPDPVLSALVAKAHVQINPAYGSWHTGQVVPPRPPGS